jgi:hypothetical protein
MKLNLYVMDVCHVADALLEIVPCVALQARVSDFLSAEPGHCTQVITSFLALEGRNSYLCQIDDEIVLDNFIILDISFGLRDVLEDVLCLRGFGSVRHKHALEGELASIHLLYSVFVVFNLADSLRFSALNAFFSGYALKNALEVHDLSLDPVANVLERVAHGRSIIN